MRVVKTDIAGRPCANINASRLFLICSAVTRYKGRCREDAAILDELTNA